MPETYMPFLGHLAELRKRIIVCLLSAGALSLVCYFFYHSIIDFITEPIGEELQAIYIAEGFLTRLWVSAVCGSIAALPVFIAQGLLFVLPVVVFRMNRNRNLDTAEGTRKADAISVRLARSLAWLFGIRVEVIGEPVQPPVLFAANHMSWLDIPVLHSGAAMGFVGKAEIEQWPVFSFIARAGGTIFHRRGSHHSAAGVTLAMAERLREDELLSVQVRQAALDLLLRRMAHIPTEQP